MQKTEAQICRGPEDKKALPAENRISSRLQGEEKRLFLADIEWRRAMLETELVDAGDLCRFFHSTSYMIREGQHRGKFPSPTESVQGKDFWRTSVIREWLESRNNLKGLV